MVLVLQSTLCTFENSTKYNEIMFNPHSFQNCQKVYSITLCQKHLGVNKAGGKIKVEFTPPLIGITFPIRACCII